MQDLKDTTMSSQACEQDAICKYNMISTLIDISIRCFRRREKGNTILAFEIKEGLTKEVAFDQKDVQLNLIPWSYIVMFNQGSFWPVDIHS